MNEKDYYGRQFWIIKSLEKEFAYYGTEAEAEQRRKESSYNQFAFASKRLATQSKEDCILIEQLII